MPDTPSQSPNILFILADDLGQGDVSCFNPHAGWHTGHIDALAAQGLRMTDSHATSSLCTPSRYAALTGRYNWRSRLKSLVLPGDSMALVEADRPTLPRLLKDNGYRTAVVGKWHLGLDWHLKDSGNDYDAFGLSADEHPEPANRMGRNGDFAARDMWHVEGLDVDYMQPVRRGPNQVGFDYSFITAASLDQPPYVYLENGMPQGVPSVFAGDQFNLDRVTDSQQQQIQKGPMVPGYDIGRVASDFQARALDVLDGFLADPDTPWFLYVPSHLVHGPVIPDAEYRGASGKGPYGDWVLQLDDYVGQLVDRIDAAGAGGNTIIVFTSDNGPSGVAGFETLAAQGHDPSNGWRGHKSDIWEGGHREPTVIRWPGTVAPGTTSDRTVAHSDLFATFAQILDVAVPEDAAEDSISNLPLWLGGDEAVRPDLISSSGGGGLAIRRGDWKLEFVTTGDGMDVLKDPHTTTSYEPAQLYNLVSDPGETDNVIAAHPLLVSELTELLAERIRRGRSTPGPDGVNDWPGPDGDWHQIGWLSDAEQVIDDARHV